MGTPNSAILDAQELRELADGQPPPARDLREFKFVVQAVLLVTEDGQVVGEEPTDPVAVYGLPGLQAYAAAFRAELANLNAKETHGMG